MRLRLLILLCCLTGLGCGGKTAADPDGAVVDTGPPPTAEPTRMVVTSGGGTTRSAHFRARLSVGAPQPYGVTAGAQNRALVGPKQRKGANP